MKTKKLTALMLAALMALSCLCCTALAEGEEGKMRVTDNINANEYTNRGRWSDTVKSYLFDNGDGTLTRVEYDEYLGVFAEIIDRDYNVLRTVDIDMELELWGGFFAGEKFNFFVFGQTNEDESNGVEVLRVVRYTKDWRRVDQVSLFGANTAAPFEGGSLRMAEKDDMLYIHTCHLMYNYGGINHQANMWLNVSAPAEGEMTVRQAGYEISNNSYDYVSHSFNQFAAADGDFVIKLDHGDAVPRSVTLCRKNVTDGFLEKIDVLPIGGEIGANDTGVSVGGLEVSDSGYIVAGNSVRMESFNPFSPRNIFVSFIDKETMEVKTAYLTDYGSADPSVSNPQLVKIDGDTLLLIWTEEKAGTDHQLKYVLLNGRGEVKGQIKTAGGYLSDCKPIVTNGTVKWYVTGGTELRMNTISLSDMSFDSVLVSSDSSHGGQPVQPETMTVTEGTKVTFQFEVQGGSPSYQWQFSEDNGLTWFNCAEYEYEGNTPIPTGSRTNEYTFTALSYRNDNLFRCYVTFPNSAPIITIPIRLKVIPGPRPEEPIPGDLNGDKFVDNVDLVTLARYLVKLETLDDTQLDAADMNEDSSIDNQDLVQLARKIVGM